MDFNNTRAIHPTMQMVPAGNMMHTTYYIVQATLYAVYGTPHTTSLIKRTADTILDNNTLTTQSVLHASCTN